MIALKGERKEDRGEYVRDVSVRVYQEHPKPAARRDPDLAGAGEGSGRDSACPALGRTKMFYL